MRAPSIPPPIAQLGSLAFSFYPAILNIQHNQWVYQSATWSEVMVRNTQTNETISIPRRYVGEVSSVEAPVAIVGLSTELEYRAGAVLPAKKRVIEMPLAVNDSRPVWAERKPLAPAAVVGIRLEGGGESRLPKMMLAGVALGVVGCVLAISVYRGGSMATRVFYAPAFQSGLPLTWQDGHASVVRSLGQPARESWHSEPGGIEYRALAYPEQRLYVILMGRDASEPRYIGAMDWNWRPFHSVALPDSGSTFNILKNLSRF